MGALGWHVHYELAGRLRVRLTCHRGAAIGTARELIADDIRVIRLLRSDGAEAIGEIETRAVCVASEPLPCEN
jgi:hypothetical protein